MENNNDTIRFVAQHLNHYATAVPLYYLLCFGNFYSPGIKPHISLHIPHNIVSIQIAQPSLLVKPLLKITVKQEAVYIKA